MESAQFRRQHFDNRAVPGAVIVVGLLLPVGWLQQLAPNAPTVYWVTGTVLGVVKLTRTLDPLTVTLAVAADAAAGAAHNAPNGRLPLLLEQTSLGDTQGNDVAVEAVNGSLLVRETAVKIALPFVKRS